MYSVTQLYEQILYCKSYLKDLGQPNLDLRYYIYYILDSSLSFLKFFRPYKIFLSNEYLRLYRSLTVTTSMDLKASLKLKLHGAVRGTISDFTLS